MPDNPAIDEWITALEPRLQPLAQALRQLIVEADPDLTEAIKWSNPVYEKHGKVCYLAATQTYVSLGFFNGTALTDPERRMEGTGKKMRHAKVRSLEDIPAPLVISWVREAVQLLEA